MFVGLFRETLTKTFVENDDALSIFKHVLLDFDLTLNQTFGLVCLLLCLIFLSAAKTFGNIVISLSNMCWLQP